MGMQRAAQIAAARIAGADPMPRPVLQALGFGPMGFQRCHPQRPQERPALQRAENPGGDAIAIGGGREHQPVRLFRGGGDARHGVWIAGQRRRADHVFARLKGPQRQPHLQVRRQAEIDDIHRWIVKDRVYPVGTLGPAALRQRRGLPGVGAADPCDLKLSPELRQRGEIRGGEIRGCLRGGVVRFVGGADKGESIGAAAHACDLTLLCGAASRA